MHKHVAKVVFAIVIVAFIVVPSSVDKLFALFFVGLVPYTNYTIPPSTMLALYALLLALGIYSIGRQLVTATSPVRRDISARDRARKKVLRGAATTPAKATKHTKKHFSTATEHQTS
jgi:hypothetical protein